eukprot:8757063-Pyramimonas_sp.AAC.1
MQELRVYSHDGPIAHRKHGFILLWALGACRGAQDVRPRGPSTAACPRTTPSRFSLSMRPTGRGRTFECDVLTVLVGARVVCAEGRVRVLCRMRTPRKLGLDTDIWMV